jgi:hypothetical protein
MDSILFDAGKLVSTGNRYLILVGIMFPIQCLDMDDSE